MSFNNLKNKDYKVKTSAKFKSCAAVAYLEDQHQKDYYELIKHETEFSEFMQSTREIMDKNGPEEKLQKIAHYCVLFACIPSDS